MRELMGGVGNVPSISLNNGGPRQADNNGLMPIKKDRWIRYKI
ncbi:hypothetical protein LMG24235_07022 [Paraburkholderia sabiae]|nr:hypothetical protein LMG24235_07022 [Paraburkholderia sabiae]